MARSIVNLDVKVDQFGMKDRYEKMLNNVANMLDTNGPIYTTWIYFQIGLNEDNKIVFDSSSTDKQQNLIASLSIEKSCSGIANTFTLVIQYDPFNFGQNTNNDTVEKLDEFIAKAMAEDFDNSTAGCRGRIQYGYNSSSASSDDELVSPLYCFFLTNATSNVSFDSGITTYTFTGTSILSADCDFVTDYDKVEDKNLLETVGKILYKYYGDPDNPPKIEGIDEIIPESPEDLKYRIDINSDDITKAVKISVDKSSNTQSPWLYCKSLLDANPLTEEEKNSEEFKDLESISLNKRPRYSMYITDVDGAQTIHIVHIAPSSTIDENGNETVVETGSMKIDYVFSWGMKNEDLQNKNIVTGWKPEVDLYTYLIRKANYARYNKIKTLYEEDPEKYEKTYENVKAFNEDVLEMYNAELELIGIPADPPMAAEIEIVPRVLETISRTAGIYVITGASDEISSTGIFKSTLKLFRVRSQKPDNYSSLTANETAQETKVSEEEKLRQARLEYLKQLDELDMSVDSSFSGSRCK